MGDKRKSALIHEVTTVKQKIGKKGREGLFTYHTEKARDDSENGRIEAWKEFAEKATPDDPRDRLFAQIEIMERQLEKMTQEERRAGAEPEPTTLLWHISRVVRLLGSIRTDIQEFENRCKDKIPRHKFYGAMERSLEVTAEIEQLTIKRNEVRLIKGEEKRFNYHGANTQKQREGAQRVRELTAEGVKRGLTEKKAKSEAVTTVAKQSGVSTSAVHGWIAKHEKINSGVVVTKTVVQDSD